MASNTAPSIFKAYDIRGLVPSQLDEGTAYGVGRAFALLRQTEVPGKRLSVCVASDMRLSSPGLKARLIGGLLDGGVDVVDVGLLSTPTFYFAVGFYGYDGGVQVSASHNPKEYNGFKLVRAKAVPVSRDSGMPRIKELVLANDFPEVAQRGTLTARPNVTGELVKEQRQGIDLAAIKPLKIVVDAANAMGAVDVEAMFHGLPCELTKLNFDLDGTFPAHQPDPMVEENMRILQAAVKEHGADLGIAPDGDGDRYFFVDEKGEVMPQSILRGVMAQIALAEHPGATVCYDIRPGRITRDMIEAAGGKAFVAPVGHSLIKEVMIKEGAVFGGESSGHYFYQLPYGTFEAPVVLVTKFLVWLSKQPGTLSQAIAPYKKYFHSGEMNFKVPDVAAALATIQKHYADAELNLLDGVSGEYPDWWFNIRGSNTEPLLRLAIEARSLELAKAKQREMLQVLGVAQ